MGSVGQIFLVKRRVACLPGVPWSLAMVFVRVLPGRLLAGAYAFSLPRHRGSETGRAAGRRVWRDGA
jgi:hypothetical protein